MKWKKWLLHMHIKIHEKKNTHSRNPMQLNGCKTTCFLCTYKKPLLNLNDFNFFSVSLQSFDTIIHKFGGNFVEIACCTWVENSKCFKKKNTSFYYDCPMYWIVICYTWLFSNDWSFFCACIGEEKSFLKGMHFLALGTNESKKHLNCNWKHSSIEMLFIAHCATVYKKQLAKCFHHSIFDIVLNQYIYSIAYSIR